MRRVLKPWGNELIWAEASKYLGKILKIEAGKRLSLHYHKVKDETIMVMSGTLLLEYGLTNIDMKTKTMNPGDVHWLQSGTLHRLTAVTTAEIVEVSTSESLDIVRLEDDYGRVKK